MSSGPSFDRTAAETVERIAKNPRMAQVRLWWIRPGDSCPTCPMRAQCPDQTRCLHLTAWHERPPTTEPADTGSRFRRLPIGAGLLGRVAVEGVGGVVRDVRCDPTWSRALPWARAAGIRGFAAEPICATAGVVGVIGVFTRAVAEPDDSIWLRIVADGLADLASTHRRIDDLERKVRERARDEAKEPPTVARRPRRRPSTGDGVVPEGEMRRRERENIENALQQTGGKVYGVGGAAELLGIRPTTLMSRIRKMGISR